jgi:ParB-like chromosome segregation protein Spo0J
VLDFDPFEAHKIEAHPVTIEERIEQANKLSREASRLIPWRDPVACVQWIHVDRLQANDYNPNSVAFHEMRLLHVSISEDGYTQPIVAIRDDTAQPVKYVIVDGFHRYTVMRRFEEIYNERSGYLPVVVLDKSIADRMASTVRHNRARGKHSVAGMGSLVFQMLREGVSDVDICNKIGLEAEELARLKHVTGFSKLYVDAEYSRPVLITPQLKAKAQYQKEHPDEHVPTDF